MTQPLKAMTPAQYDVGWDTRWDDMKKYGPMSRHVRRIIKKLIRPLSFTSVMDVGSGQGSLLLELVEEWPHIEPNGTDISTAAVELARRRVPHGEFHLLDLAREHVDRQYDLVICSEVVEHIEDDLAAMRNLRTMTRGHLVISTVQGRMRRFEAGEVGHVRNYARGELAAKLQQAGFEVIRSVDWGFPFYSPLYRNFLELTSSKGTTGEFGPARRMVATALYYLFHLNLPIWGDEIFILARPAQQHSGPALAGTRN
jgi:2-polyprenyl-3-methyl-5-hydroxy-6-metoxy-1,4-benzoquinol methylase